ncbi:Protein of unknown function [Lachnospiraceae bacterium XBB1006]|nr:Protein of unknown function [Lachnospiraceae bacterium XBB1006]
MQEDIEERTVRLAISTARVTARNLVKGIQLYLRHRQNKNLEDDKIQGKQSIEELVKQDQGVTSMVVGDSGIRKFERIAKKYGVDFAVVKDKSENPPRYTVFFKARDTDAMEAVMKDYGKIAMKLKQRPSVLAKLHRYIEIAAKQMNQVRRRERELER